MTDENALSTVFSISSYQSTCIVFLKVLINLLYSSRGCIFLVLSFSYRNWGKIAHTRFVQTIVKDQVCEVFIFYASASVDFYELKFAIPVACVECIWHTRLAASKVGVVNEQKLQILTKS